MGINPTTKLLREQKGTTMSYVMFVFCMTATMIITPVVCSTLLHICVEAVAFMNNPEFKKVAAKAFLEAQAGVTLVDGKLEAGVELIENYGTIEEATLSMVDRTMFSARVELAQENNTVMQQVRIMSCYFSTGTALPTMSCY